MLGFNKQKNIDEEFMELIKRNISDIDWTLILKGDMWQEVSKLIKRVEAIEKAINGVKLIDASVLFIVKEGE